MPVQRILIIFFVLIVTCYSNCKAYKKSSSLEGIAAETRSGTYLIFAEAGKLVKTYCPKDKTISYENCKLQRTAIDYESFKSRYENILFNGAPDLEAELKRLNTKRTTYLQINPNAGNDDLTLRAIDAKISVYQNDLAETATEREIFRDILKNLENRDEIITFKNGVQESRPGRKLVEKIADEAFAMNGQRLSVSSMYVFGENLQSFLKSGPSFNSRSMCYAAESKKLYCWISLESSGNDVLKLVRFQNGNEILQFPENILSVAAISGANGYISPKLAILTSGRESSNVDLHYFYVSYGGAYLIRKQDAETSSNYIPSIKSIQQLDMDPLSNRETLVYSDTQSNQLWSTSLEKIQKVDINFPFAVARQSFNVVNRVWLYGVITELESGVAHLCTVATLKSNEEIWSDWKKQPGIGKVSAASDGTIKLVSEIVTKGNSSSVNFISIPEDRGLIDLSLEMPWKKRYFLLDQAGLSSVRAEKGVLVYEKINHQFDLSEAVEVKSAGGIMCVTGGRFIQCDKFVDASDINKLSGNPWKIDVTTLTASD